jgi:hypothetical protein
MDEWKRAVIYKVAEYDIVVGSGRPDDIQDFVAEVSAKLADHWQLLGETWESPEGTLKQAMIR